MKVAASVLSNLPTEPVAAEPVATEAVPDEAIAALESAGTTTDIYLPPAAPLPMPPSQAFLPITPTPVSDGTPTPEPETQADAPQLAEDWSDDPGVTALAPEAPQVTDAAVADVTAAETDESESGRSATDRRRTASLRRTSSQRTATMLWAGRWRRLISAQSAELLQTTDEPDGATTETAARRTGHRNRAGASIRSCHRTGDRPRNRAT